MFPINWLKQLGNPFVVPSRTAEQYRYSWQARRRPPTRPCLETLEERCLLDAGGAVASTAGLIAAIKAANSSGSPTKITLAPGATFDFKTANNSTNGGNALPVVTGNITVVGNDDIIERTGSNAFRLFDVRSGGSLTLENMTLTGGLAQGIGTAAEGGAIYSSGALNLAGVTVGTNMAVGLDGSNGTSKDWRSGGAGANAAGGGIYVAGGTLVLSNDTIISNSVRGGKGGNGYGYSRGGHFLGNNGGNGGSASGGGVFVAQGSLSLSGDTVMLNNVHGGTGGKAASGAYSGAGGAGGSGGTASGGGLYVVGGGFRLNGDSFSWNFAQGGNGGNGGNGSYPGASNHAIAGAGGLGGTASGGGLYATQGGLTLSDDGFSLNNAQGGAGGNGGSYGIHGPGNGGSGGNALGGGVFATAHVVLPRVVTLVNGSNSFDGGADATSKVSDFTLSSNITALVDTLLSSDNGVTAGSPGTTSGGLPGHAVGPLIYGRAMTISAGTPLPPGTVGTPYNAQTINVHDNNGTTATLSYNITSSPLGLNFTANGSVLTISGTPSAAGTVTFTLIATDTYGSTIPQEYTLAINPLPIPPPPAPSHPAPTSPSALNVPPLLTFLDQLFEGTETVNADGTATIVDRIFGIPLLVASFDDQGNLLSVTLLGIDVTLLFKL
jgi:hypothetical protein